MYDKDNYIIYNFYFNLTNIYIVLIKVYFLEYTLVVIVMNIYLISEYVNRMKKEDINKFALKQGIILDDSELDTIYNYVKKDYKTFIYGNPRSVLDELKEKVKPLTYNKIENLYQKFKDKI